MCLLSLDIGSYARLPPRLNLYASGELFGDAALSRSPCATSRNRINLPVVYHFSSFDSETVLSRQEMCRNPEWVDSARNQQRRITKEKIRVLNSVATLLTINDGRKAARANSQTTEIIKGGNNRQFSRYSSNAYFMRVLINPLNIRWTIFWHSIHGGGCCWRIVNCSWI